VLKARLGSLAPRLNSAVAKGAAKQKVQDAHRLAERLHAEVRAMRKAGIKVSRRLLARRLGEGRNTNLFRAAWDLAGVKLALGNGRRT
jgi:hypothetical protein